MIDQMKVMLDRSEASLVAGACLTFASVPFRTFKPDLDIDRLDFHDSVFQSLVDARTKSSSPDEKLAACIPARDLTRLVTVLSSILEEYPSDSMELSTLVATREDVIDCYEKLLALVKRSNIDGAH